MGFQLGKKVLEGVFVGGKWWVAQGFGTFFPPATSLLETTSLGKNLHLREGTIVLP